MVPELLTSLELDNPWLRGEAGARWAATRLPSPWIPRALGPVVAHRWEATDRAHLVVGPRQAGKSSLIWRYLSDRTEPALFIDCEASLARDWCRTPSAFLGDVAGLVRPRTTLFFEEVQHLAEAGLFLKGLVDRGYDGSILATGSSSYHLQAGTRESLAGRATRTRLLPLSAAEVCHDLVGQPELLLARRIGERLTRHFVVGGFPAVWTAERPGDVLTELVEAFVLRDASDLHNIARPDAFRRLLALIAGQVGSLVNYAEWASLLGISRDTVAAYVAILTDAHVLAELRPFAGGKRSEVTSRPKVYFVDPGIRSQLSPQRLDPWESRADRGPALEGWVLSELAKAAPTDATLHFWRTGAGAEVDFVVARGVRPALAVEVKAAALTRPTLPRSARSFVDAYAPDALIVVNLGLDHEERLDATRVRWITPATWTRERLLGQPLAPGLE